MFTGRVLYPLLVVAIIRKRRTGGQGIEWA
jgi:hypothetical protein